MIDDVATNRRRAVELVAAVTVPVAVVLALVGVLLRPAGLVLVLLAVVWGWYAWRQGPTLVARAVGGTPAHPVAHARFHNLVDSLGIAAGVPKPSLVVVDDPAPNALAYGLEPRSATLVVTTGLLDRLTRVELEGVLARELATIKSYEIRPATVAVAVLRLLAPIPPLAERVRDRAVRTPAVATDASGVAITRYPPGLAAAFEKLLADGPAVRAGGSTTAHLWMVPPGTGATDVHPPLEERIAALREL